MKRCIIIVGSIFFGLIGFFTFAQTPFGEDKEYVSPEEFKMKVVVQKKAEEIKHYYFDLVYAAQAVRNNDLSFCSEAKNYQECQSDARWLIELRALAEGDCLKVGKDFNSQICEAINNNNCKTLSEDEKDVCSAFLNRNLKLLSSAGLKVLGYDRGESLMDARWDLNFFYGFKYYSVNACNRFPLPSEGGFYLPRIACKVLFANRNSQEIIDEHALDLAYLEYIKKSGEKNSNLCEKVKDGFLRQRCRNLDYQMKDFYK